jgi:hypothetical protein
MRRFLICLSTIMLQYVASTVIGQRNRCSVEPLIVEAMKSIDKAEILFSVTTGRGKFTDLETLGKTGLIDRAIASGVWDGYNFEIALTGTAPSMFDLTAKPITGAEPCPGSHSFYSNETTITYRSDGAEPPRASAPNRVPAGGVLTADAPGDQSCP